MSRGRRWEVWGVSAAALVVASLAGCRTAPPRDPRPALESPPPLETLPAPAPAVAAPQPMPVRPSVLLLAEADWLLSEGNYNDAVRAYEAFLRFFPEDAAASRVRATRGILSSLVATNAEVIRLREQTEATERDLARVRRDLAVRQAELGRVRQELAERQAELARLTQETDNLRLDLERLKSVDLRLERPR